MKTQKRVAAAAFKKYFFQRLLLLLTTFLLVLSPILPARGEDLVFSVTQKNLAAAPFINPPLVTTKEALDLLTQIQSSRTFPVTENFRRYTKAQGDYQKGTLDTKKWLQHFFEQYKGDLITWPLEDQYAFDQMLLAFDITHQPQYFLPKEGELTRDEALAITKKLALDYDLDLVEEDFDSFQSLSASLFASDEYNQILWKVVLRKPSPDFVTYLKTDGELVSFERQEGMEVSSPTLKLQAALEKEKGLFQFWSLEDKAWLSAVLPALIDKETYQGNKVFPIAYAIASYRFTLPPEEAIGIKAATNMAINASQKNFSLPNHWLESVKIGTSFFYNDDNLPIWRITFWPAPAHSIDGFYGARVELNALTGQILIIEKNGNTSDTTIPYENRI